MICLSDAKSTPKVLLAKSKKVKKKIGKTSNENSDIDKSLENVHKTHIIFQKKVTVTQSFSLTI